MTPNQAEKRHCDYFPKHLIFIHGQIDVLKIFKDFVHKFDNTFINSFTKNCKVNPSQLNYCTVRF